MDFNEYQKQAMKTKQGTADLLYSATKLHCEAGELAQPVIKQQYHGKPLDVDAMIDESGDILWYLASIAQDLGVTLEEVAQRNIRKLRARHGEQYSPEFYRG